VYIPAGAVIESAFIQFRSDEVDSDFAEFLIFSENTGNAAPFDDGDIFSVSARAVFDNPVYWTPPAWTSTGLTGPAQKTPDVGDLLQQVINQDDWTAGNDIVFKIEGTGVSLTNENALRVADSYEGKPEYPATLTYTFSYDATVTDVNEEKLSAAGYVYPNPFENTLHFTVDSKENGTAIVLISDILGNKIFTKTIELKNNIFTINPDIQTQGVFIVTVLSASEGVILKQKIIKY
jgi:hypothetical protein